jgi:NADPH2:quinone reductase
VAQLTLSVDYATPATKDRNFPADGAPTHDDAFAIGRCLDLWCPVDTMAKLHNPERLVVMSLHARVARCFALGLLLILGAAHANAGDGLAGPVPSRMRAAAIDVAGEAAVLTLHDLAVPQPGADEVLIATHTAGVAGWDVDIRRHPQSINNSRFPLVLGTDGSGVIAALGAKVRGFQVGEAVYSYSWDNPKGGFYAEYVAVPAERVSPVPKGLTMTQAGAIGTNALTAIQGIDDALHITAGETLIIHGAAGGVGTLAVQFAKLRGAKILAIVSGPDQIGAVTQLGADAVVDGRHGDILAAARAFAPSGVDAVLALAGGDALQRCIDAARPGGRLAYPSGVQVPKPRPGQTVVRYDAVPGPKQFARLNEAIAAVKLQVPIAAEFPLAAAADAQRRVEAGHVLGKLVLRIAP